MRIATAFSTDTDSARAIEHAAISLQKALGGPPHWLLVQSSIGHDVEVLHAALARHPLTPKVHGGSSCLGVMTQAGVHTQGNVGLGLLGIRDDLGAFGVGAARLGDSPKVAARQALIDAIEAADRPGETPSLLWVSSVPGSEEEILVGLAAVVGPQVPVVGGSTADNTVEGQWYQFTQKSTFRDAVVVSALYPSTAIGSSFQSGYSPTEKRGVVTRTQGRTLLELDGEPAAARYNAWTGGVIDAGIARRGGTILAQTSLFPLGVQVGQAAGVPYYRLLHPESVTADGGLALFAGVAEGDTITLMQGAPDGIVARAGRVASDALAQIHRTPAQTAGALVIFCAGCMLAVRERMTEVVAGLKIALPDVPFLGCFTFGEQGCFIGGENRHGNLMISIAVIAREP